MEFQKIRYEDLNARQKENYNFHKIAAKLVDYGFTCVRLSDDWKGADFIAIHIDGKTDLKVQLKGRLSIYKKYNEADLYLCFPDGDNWYLYPHDEVQEKILGMGLVKETKSWQKHGGYSFPGLSKNLKKLLADYRIS